MMCNKSLTVELWFDRDGNRVTPPKLDKTKQFIHIPMKETEWGEWQHAFNTAEIDGEKKITDITLWRVGEEVDE